MGIFDKATAKATEQWLNGLTMAELDRMEAQGYDVSGYRAEVSKRQAVREEIERNKPRYTIEYDRLLPHLATPRDVNGEFFLATAGKKPLFGKDRWEESMANMPIVYAGIVQASSSAWSPIEDRARYGMVVVLATDAAHMHDKEWAVATADKISQLKNTKDVPHDCKKLIAELRNSQSSFCLRVGESISGGATAWCATKFFDEAPTQLPNACLPSDRILPILLREEPKENHFLQSMFIPVKFLKGDSSYE